MALHTPHRLWKAGAGEFVAFGLVGASPTTSGEWARTICKTLSSTRARQQSAISRTVRRVKQRASQRLAHLVRYLRRVSGKD